MVLGPQNGFKVLEVACITCHTRGRQRQSRDRMLSLRSAIYRGRKMLNENWKKKEERLKREDREKSFHSEFGNMTGSRCQAENKSPNEVFTTFLKYTIFYRQLDFPSEPGVANEILVNEPKSCSMVAYFYSLFLNDYAKITCFERKRPI